MGYGYGGQFVAVFPTASLIVVSTAHHQVDTDQSTVQEWAIFDIIADYIVAAINKLKNPDRLAGACQKLIF